MRYLPLMITKMFQADLDPGDLDGSRTREQNKLNEAKTKLDNALREQTENELLTAVITLRETFARLGYRISFLNCILFSVCIILKCMQKLQQKETEFNSEKGQTLKLYDGILTVHNQPTDEI